MTYICGFGPRAGFNMVKIEGFTEISATLPRNFSDHYSGATLWGPFRGAIRVILHISITWYSRS